MRNMKVKLGPNGNRRWIFWFGSEMNLSRYDSVGVNLKTGVNRIRPSRKSSTVRQQSSALVSEVHKWKRSL